MSTVIAKNVQIGTSGTATDNFTIFQPATPDGTLRIGNGNTGITTSQVALTSAGNVGIGTSSPSAKLDVSSANNIIKSTGSSGYAAFYANAATGNAAYNFFGVNGTETARIYSDSANYLAFSTGSAATEQMRLNSTGLGIGTTSPAYPLDITKSVAGSLRAQVRNTDSGAGSTSYFTLGNDLSSSEAGLILASSTNSTFGNRALAVYNSASAPVTFWTNNTERARIDSTGARSTVIPSGSTLYPAFDCRAWVNFNGTGTVAIRSSGNVSSITDNGTGDYTVNFSTAMPDANYSAVGTQGLGGISLYFHPTTPFQTSGIRVVASNTAGGGVDAQFVCVSIFR